MKYKIGDKVKFLNDVGGGTIVKIIDEETVAILNEDGFEIPYITNELLKDEVSIDYKSNETILQIPEEPEVEEEIFYSNREDINIYLAYVPKKQNLLTDCDSDIYLINDSNYFLLYNYSVKKDEKYIAVTGKLEPNTKKTISTLLIELTQDKIQLAVHIIFYDKEKHNLHEPLLKYFNINPTKFYKKESFVTNDFFDEKALVIPVLEENPMQKAVENLQIKVSEQEIEEKEKKQRKRIQKPSNQTKLKEVDLHLVEIIDDETGLPNHEKLKLQIDKFHSEMKSAIKERYEKVVFIHGVGNGALKHELRRELQRKYKQYVFQDASFQEYGYGATMVILKQRKTKKF